MEIERFWGCIFVNRAGRACDKRGRAIAITDDEIMLEDRRAEAIWSGEFGVV